jgi:hypothetical protein
MEYFLAYISNNGKGYYELVKANSREEAYEKVRKLVSRYDEIEISSAIE